MPAIDDVITRCRPDPDRARLDATGTWPAALVHANGQWLTVHSRRDPLAEARRAVEAVRADAALVVVIGLGLGYLLDAFEEREWAGRVVALEPEPALVPLFWQRRDWSAWRDRLVLHVIGDGQAPPADLWRSFTRIDTEPAPIVNPVLARTHEPAVARARAILSRAWFDHEANEQARRKNAGIYLLNTLRNAPALAREGDVAALDGLCAGLPVLIVGAGPSLDDNMRVIAAHQGRAVIIAVDTALRPLLAAGVSPHFVIAIDPTETNARHLSDLPACPRTWLVAEASIDPWALAHFTGQTFFCRLGVQEPWPWLERAGLGCGTIRAWGSVLTSALDLALRLGCTPVVFAGADLAFSGGRPYARGTTYEEDWARLDAWGMPLRQIWATCLDAWPAVEEQGVSGGPERTAPHLRAFRDWIVRQAATSPEPFINGSGQGILVGPHVSQAPLDDVLRGRPVLPASWSDVIASAWARRPAAEQRQPPTPDAATMTAWQAFAPALSMAALEAALAGPGTTGYDLVPAGDRPGPSAAFEGSDEERRALDQLVSDDRAFLSLALASVAPADRHVLVVDNPSIDLQAKLDATFVPLPVGGIIAIIDVHLGAAGAQVRRAAEALLAAHPDAGFESRRFAHTWSRVSILRRLDGALTGDLAEADRRKHGPAEAETAARLVPVIVNALRPSRVIDVGCGDGSWVRALRRAGVTDAVGLPAVSLQGGQQQQRVDVCLCLEVAQYAGPGAEAELVATCAALSDTVVFSSAPPGAPGASPHTRPLSHWTRLFVREGYVLDDSLRPVVEQTSGAPRAVADCLVVFRRAADPQAVAALEETLVAQAARIHDLYMQTAWWQVALHDVTVSGEAPLPPEGGYPLFVLPSARLWPGTTTGEALFVFRSDLARWVLSRGHFPLEVTEDGRALAALQPDTAETQAGWCLRRDHLSIRTADGTNPRVNGLTYAVRVPAAIARAESEWWSTFNPRP